MAGCVCGGDLRGRDLCARRGDGLAGVERYGKHRVFALIDGQSQRQKRAVSSDALVGDGHAAQSRDKDLVAGQVVEAGDRQILRNAQAVSPGDRIHAVGGEIGDADDGGRAPVRGHAQQAIHGRSQGVLEVVGMADQCASVVNILPIGLQGVAISQKALPCGRAVVVPQKGDAAVTGLEQRCGRFPNAATLIVGHGRHLVQAGDARDAAQHQRCADGGQNIPADGDMRPVRRACRSGADEQHARNPLPGEQFDGFAFVRHVGVRRIGQQHGAVASGHAVHALGDAREWFGEKGVRDEGQRLGAGPRHRLRQAVDHIIEIPGLLRDPRPRIRADHRVAGKGPRGGGDGHPGGFRHILQGGVGVFPGGRAGACAVW